MKRKIITVNEDLCDGCGNCVSACSEGALQIIDGKAKLVKEDFCDGFGDCIGECPKGALTIEERGSKPFDEQATKDHLLKTQGKEAVQRMEEALKKHAFKECLILPCSYPENLSHKINRITESDIPSHKKKESQLRNWPIQINLLPMKAPYYENADLLVAADCCAYAHADFHSDYIKEHTLLIGCPKLDHIKIYKEKLTGIITNNNIRSITVTFLEVPCCWGLVRLVEEALRESGKDIPINKVKIGIKGEIQK